ncbi:MAG: hypothetical protein NW207_09210 [Cytophagales bacterium]|nr:hypothetical protein [Cytophagales bacterium]
MFIYSCQDIQNIPPEVTINLFVRNEFGHALLGATVYVFNNPTSYETKNISTAYRTATTQIATNGDTVATIVLSAETEYWVYTTYRDPLRQLTLTNYSVNNGKYNGYLKRLSKRTNIDLRLIVRPEDANIIFYSTATNKLPIEISVGNFSRKGGITTHTLSALFSLSRQPTVLDVSSTALVSQKQPGRYSYYAKSADGCVWQGDVNVTRGQSIPIDLTKCNTGTISFYTDATHSLHTPIKIHFNDQNITGEVLSITGTLATAPTCTSLATAASGTTATFVRNPGLHSYIAYTKDSTCVWTGNVSLTVDQCVIIPLTKCE